MKKPEPAISLLGISYRTAPIEVLERLALSSSEIEGLYERLAASGAILDAMVLSTCNRTEIYTRAKDEVEAAKVTTAALEEIAGKSRVPEADHFYRFHGREGISHLFRVCSGIDSMILGEAQILGQVRDAYDRSCEIREPTLSFRQVVQSAFRVAARSRNDTGIGEGAVSVASAAVHLATRTYSDLSRRNVTVVGAGETGRLVAEHLSKKHPKKLWITNRTAERAEDLARSLGGEARPLDELQEAIAASDIVACAVGTSEPILTREIVDGAMRKRRGRALVMLDLGMPRNIAPDADDTGNVFLHDIDTLRQVVDKNLSRRRKAVPEVEELIQSEVDRLAHVQRATSAGPLIKQLREVVERTRQAEVRKLGKELSEAESEVVERVTRSLVNKLMHGSTMAIKGASQRPDGGTEQLLLVRSMFSHLGLDQLPLSEEGKDD